jgi:hypothetical protein
MAFIQKFFFYLTIMLLASSLLMIVANNIPIVMSFRYFWGPIALISILAFKPRVYLQKPVINILLYGFLYCFVLQYLIWPYENSWYKNVVLDDFYSMIVAGGIWSYFILSKDYFSFFKVAKIGLVFIIITGIMTIICSLFEPLIIRYSYQGLTNFRGYSKLFKLGFGGYGFITALIPLCPIIIFFIKNNTIVWLKKKYWIILLILLFIVIIRSQIVANILICAFVIILSFISVKKIKIALTIGTFFIIVLYLIPVTFWSDMLLSASSYFNPHSEIYNKLVDMSHFILNPNTSGDGGEAAARTARYPLLLEALYASPIFGDASYSSPYYYNLVIGGHLHWMSRLALWGIFGFVGYILILRNIFKSVLKTFNEEFVVSYIISLLSLVILGFIKSFGGREIYIVLLIIIPGLYAGYCLNFKDLQNKINNNDV